jgi:hypothetical protein
MSAASWFSYIHVHVAHVHYSRNAESEEKRRRRERMHLIHPSSFLCIPSQKTQGVNAGQFSSAIGYVTPDSDYVV